MQMPLKKCPEVLHVIAGIILLFSCTSQSGNTKDYSPKFQQYYVQGEVLYQEHCSNCHQSNGKGLGRLYPPVDQSDFMDKDFEQVICIIKYGKQGSLLINDIEYNMTMKGNPGLTDLEVAEIATYIYNTWSHNKGLIDVREVTALLSTCNN
jgi:mono/diheme cytochrome c family protein